MTSRPRGARPRRTEDETTMDSIRSILKRLQTTTNEVVRAALKRKLYALRRQRLLNLHVNGGGK